jgi:predicted dehydrogenase
VRAPVRLGIVGLGERGTAFARVLAELPQAQLRWLCDHRGEVRLAARTRFPSARTTSELEELLADESIDGVVVATPRPTRYDLVRNAIAHEKHVLVLGPVARTAEEAGHLVRAAEHHDRALVVAQPLLFHPAVAKLKELTTGRTLGELLYIHAEERDLHLRAEGRDPLWEVAADLVTTIVHLLGDEPVEATARAESYVGAPVPDVVFAHLAFATGVGAHLHVSCLDPVPTTRVTFVGSKRMIVFDANDRGRELSIHDKTVVAHPDSPRSMFVKVGQTTSPWIRSVDPLTAACDHFVAAIRAGGDSLGTAHCSAIAVSVLDALERSLAADDTPQGAPPVSGQRPVRLLVPGRSTRSRRS